MSDVQSAAQAHVAKVMTERSWTKVTDPLWDALDVMEAFRAGAAWQKEPTSVSGVEAAFTQIKEHD